MELYPKARLKWAELLRGQIFHNSVFSLTTGVHDSCHLLKFGKWQNSDCFGSEHDVPLASFISIVPDSPDAERNIPRREPEANMTFLDHPVIVVEVGTTIPARVVTKNQMYGPRDLAGGPKPSGNASVSADKISDGSRPVVRGHGAQAPSSNSRVGVSGRHIVRVGCGEQAIAGHYRTSGGNVRNPLAKYLGEPHAAGRDPGHEMRDFSGGRNSQQGRNHRIDGDALDKCLLDARSSQRSGELELGGERPGKDSSETVDVCGAELPGVSEMLKIVAGAYGAPAADPVLYIPVCTKAVGSYQAFRTIAGQKVVPAQIEGKPGCLLNF